MKYKYIGKNPIDFKGKKVVTGEEVSSKDKLEPTQFVLVENKVKKSKPVKKRIKIKS